MLFKLIRDREKGGLVMAKQNLANSVANDLFKTIDLLASQQINRLEFDKTMICTITKNNEIIKQLVIEDNIEFVLTELLDTLGVDFKILKNEKDMVD
jgi:hypothetical protein